jgi:hypothetical protein
MERSEQDLREPHNKKLDFTTLTTIIKKKKQMPLLRSQVFLSLNFDTFLSLGSEPGEHILYASLTIIYTTKF